MVHQAETGPAQLKDWRLREGISQEVAAKRLGASQGLYSGWERGKKTPTILRLGKIRKIAGISLEVWLPVDLRLLEPLRSLAPTKARRSRPARAAA